MNAERALDIIKYKMNPEHTKAFRIALEWEELAPKYFPGVRTGKLKATGDPRQSDLFKTCFKLVRETEFLLDEEQYLQYVQAQLHIIKILLEQNPTIYVGPHILVGEKAWKRWLVWKRRYDKKMAAVQTAEDVGATVDNTKIESELKRTRDFILREFKSGYPTAKSYENLISDLTIIRWLTLGKMSMYYAILSPNLKKALGDKNIEERFGIDISMFTPFRENQDCRELFKKYFPEENL